MSLEQHVAGRDNSSLDLRFRHPLLIEVEGDRSELGGHTCEVVDVYECPHRGGAWTILHVPHGSLPAPAVAAEPIRYEFD
jgi:hypothetical protein